MRELISAGEFCASHQIEVSFISSLKDSGLIEVTTIEQKEYIPATCLKDLESMVHLYYDLDINLEGIETILHLLQKMDKMHDEIVSLRNRLRLYETGE